MPGTRRATIFGGSGFIGRYIVKRLANQGVVCAVVGRHAARSKFLQPMGDVGQIAQISARLDDEAAVAASIAGADLVVNLVGILREGGRQRFEAVHHQGAERVARLAAAAGVRRLVHFSAIAADPASESLYARTKAAGEQAVRAAFPGAAILRPSIVFGPEDQFFNRFAVMAKWLPFLPLIGGGKTRFQPVYVGDVADAAIAALERPGAEGTTYEIGGPRIYTFRELMELMLREIQRKKRLVSISFGLAETLARFAELTPDPPITRDQVRLLKRDNVVADGVPTLADLGISPTAAELVLPTYLGRFRPGGWFANRRTA